MFGWKVAHFRPARVRRKGVEKYETAVAADGKGFPDLEIVRREPGFRVWLVKAELKSRRAPGPTAEQLDWLACYAPYSDRGIVQAVWRPQDWELIRATLEDRTRA